MSISSALADPVLAQLGPLPITRQVVTTWALMAVLAGSCALLTRRMQLSPGRVQVLLEALVLGLAQQLREIIQRDPAPFMPLLASLFLFIVAASLAALIPGVHAPTAHLETPAALALVVFVSVHAYGIAAQGLGRYLRGYLEPTPFMLPLNILSELTRTFSLMVRLLGNMLSHEIVIAVIVTLAGLLVPIPFMLLGVLIGLIQAFIFTMLASVFIGAAIGAIERG